MPDDDSVGGEPFEPVQEVEPMEQKLQLPVKQRCKQHGQQTLEMKRPLRR